MTDQERAELAAAATRADDLMAAHKEALAERDAIIARLVAGGVRATAVADELGKTPRAIWDAIRRVEGD